LRLVIIGNGVAGISCAFTARERDPEAEITVVGGETDYFFSRTALMYAFMDVLPRHRLEPYERSVWERQRLRCVRDWVVDLDADRQTVTLEGGDTLPYDHLVLAVGSRPNMFPWKGTEELRDGLVHFVSMQDLDACERLTPSTRRAVVVGGGLIGIELVECLRFHGVEVTFLIREPYYWPVALTPEEANVVTEEMRRHGVDVRLDEEMTEVFADGAGRVSAVETRRGERIECQLLGICAGVRPNVDRLKAFSQAPELGRGIIVDPLLRTSLPGVWACGDCAEIHAPDQRRPLIEQIWYSARRQGAYVGRNVFGEGLRYTPPTFYNSSKFFELEFTTAGEVMSLPEGTPTIYRTRPGRQLSQRIFHDGERVLGFNMLGSRWNHELLVRWIEERWHPEQVLKHLERAQFDVELGRADLAVMTEQAVPLKKVWQL
jgi:NADPH-dependent 2,4-dienoyl-CoA reductase/sulfur reductase-like enzyme